MNRIVIQEGYTLPFDGARRKKRSKRASGAFRRQQSTMKACAKKWNKSGSGSYKAFMKKCLKK